YAAVYNFGPRWTLKRIEGEKKFTPKVSMLNTACLTCSPTETIAIQESKSFNWITSEIVNIPPKEEFTQEKLDIIKNEVAKLEASGSVSLEDLEKIQINTDPNERSPFGIEVH